MASPIFVARNSSCNTTTTAIEHDDRSERTHANENPAKVESLGAEERGELLRFVAKQESRNTAEQHEQADRHNDRGVGVTPLEGSHDDALKHSAEHEREHHCSQHRDG